MGICQFCFSLSFSLIHSDSLSPNTYWLLSCLMSSPDFCHTECNFPPAASVMRSKWKIINILLKKKWSCVSYFKYCHFPPRARLPLRCSFSPPPHQGDADDHIFFCYCPPPQLLYVCMCMCWSVKAVENPTGIQNDICSLSPQRVFNLETLTGADEAAVSVVLSEKTEWHH